MTIFYSVVEPLSKYSPVTLHLSPAVRILNENPGVYGFFFSVRWQEKHGSHWVHAKKTYRL